MMTLADQQAEASADSHSSHGAQCKCGHHSSAEKSDSCGTHGSSCGCGGHSHQQADHHGGGCACGQHHPAEQQAPAEKKSCGCGRLKPFRKIHTVCGIAFCMFAAGHFVVLATAWKPEAFSQNARALHTLSANLPVIELIGLLIPTVVLIVCGLYLLWNAGLRYNAKKCNRGGKLRFFLQRMTALILLGFLLVHVLSFSSWGNRLLGITSATQTTAGFDSEHAMASATSSMRHPFGLLQTGNGAPIMAAVMTGIYALGIFSLAYHFSNGLWTAAVMWGVIPSPEHQKRWLKICMVTGAAIAAAGLIALAAFLRS